MDPAACAALRDRMLDAAEAVVVRQGIANLTLDAVAAEAGVSKGGLLHHFPSKDKLVEAMVVRCAEAWRCCAQASYDAAPPGPGRMARAMVSHLEDPGAWSEQCQRSSSAVFAALAQNPALIQPMRAVYAEVRARLAGDGLAPGVGETVIAAMDGLWLSRVLGLTRVDRGLLDLVRSVLAPLVAEGVRAAGGSKGGRTAGEGAAGGRVRGKKVKRGASPRVKRRTSR
jgi:AcrR family transcriptional regulator